MNWKEEAAQKLRSYEMMRQAMENLPREIARLEADSKEIHAQSMDMPSGTGDRRSRETRLLNNIVRRQELAWSLEQVKQWMQNVSSALAALEPVERELLRRTYIAPKSGAVDRLCEGLKMEKSSVYRHRAAALRRFTIAMYGATEAI